MRSWNSDMVSKYSARGARETFERNRKEKRERER
jgi:hypothetical protein